MGAQAPSHPAAGSVLRRRPTRAAVAVLVAALALVAFYAWTASSSGNPFDTVTPFQFKYGDSDYSNLQADAFLHGRLWLDVPVDPGLASAANPYDPTLPGFHLPDGSFYDGRYYLTWGPAPALTTFLPARLLGLELRENLAVVLYALIGVLCAWGSLALLVRRLVGDAPRLVIWAGNATLALAGALPWILRRPTVYEVALTAAFCFAMAGLYLLLREVTRPDGPRTSRLAWVGVLYGLAVLSRPTLGLVAVATAGFALLLRHDGRLPRALTPVRRRALALVVGLPVLAGLLFMAYNAARFSGPLDFGSKYQFGGRDVRFLPYNTFANLPPSLFGYFAAPLRIGLEFPYVHLPPPPAGPFSGPVGFSPEPTASVLWSVPFVLLALVLLVRTRAGRSRAPGAPLLARVVLALIAIAALPVLAGAYAIPGYTERYELDFLPYLVIAAAIGWAALVSRARTRRRAGGWRIAGLALVLWSVVIGVAIGFTGYDDSLKRGNPARFQSLERLFSPLPTLATAALGRPVIAGIEAPGGLGPAPVGYTTLGPGNSTVVLRPDAPARMTIVAPGERDTELRFGASTDVPGRFVVTGALRGAAAATNLRNGESGALPLHLRRGVNYVQLFVAPGPGVPAAAQPALGLAGVRLR